MRWRSSTRTQYLGLAILISGAVLLSGIAMGQRWLMLTGYLLTVTAWWARQGLPFTTRRINWRRRQPPRPPKPLSPPDR